MLIDVLNGLASPLDEPTYRCMMEWLRESDNQDTRGLRYAAVGWIEYLERHIEQMEAERGSK